MIGGQVNILMGVYNGAPFLAEQLQSLASQTHTDWRLICSDDGSSDETRTVIEEFSSEVDHQVELIDGPRKGFAENFLSMVRALPDDCGLIAFADQDDIWLPDKLACGVSRIGQYPSDQLALYGTASWIWDAERDKRRPSLRQRYPHSFRNALLENFATGNTMLLNQPAARLLRDASRRIGPVFAHDWWAYALLSGHGARIIYDDRPSLLYRQHGQNEIGAGETFLKRLRRNLTVAEGGYRKKIGQNIDALRAVSDLLTPIHRAELEAFATARDTTPAHRRLFGTLRSGVYRQSRRDMLGFLGATCLGLV